MALNDLETIYPGRVSPPDTDYPAGAPVDESAPGANDGTPIKQAWLRDLWGSFHAVIKLGGVTLSGVVETANDSDFVKALKIAVLKWVSDNNLSGMEDNATSRNNIDVYSKGETRNQVTARISTSSVLFDGNSSGFNFTGTWPGDGLYLVKVDDSATGNMLIYIIEGEYCSTCNFTTASPRLLSLKYTPDTKRIYCKNMFVSNLNESTVNILKVRKIAPYS